MRPGDLIVVFEEKEHEHFTRHGDNVIYELPISFTTAALGGEVSVPTISGFETLAIPAGTQSGKVLKLKGKGIPQTASQRQRGSTCSGDSLGADQIVVR